MVRFSALLFTIVTLLAWQPLPAWSASMPEARALLEQGNDSEAVKMLSQLAALDSNDYQVWFMLGVAEAHRKNFQEAIKHFKKVAELRPALAEPHNNLAVIYNEMGDLRAAVKELETSIELNPEYATAQENIGDLYVKLALESYQKAMIDQDAGPDINPELQLRYQRLLHLRDAQSAEAAQLTDKRKAAPASVAVPANNAPEVIPVLTGGIRADVLAAVEHWRAVWSARDVDAYFAAYGEDFKPGAKHASLAAWKKYKQRTIRNKSMIDVQLDNIQLAAAGADSVVVDFVQRFKSDGYQSTDHKQLTLKKYQDGWKVIDESVL